MGPRAARRVPWIGAAALLVALVIIPTDAPWAARVTGEPIAIMARDVPLDPADATVGQVGGLSYKGGLVLTSTDRRFGGWSGMQISADGTQLRAISDEGWWLAARLVETDGRVSGLVDAQLGALAGIDGKPGTAKADNDAEALAIDAEGNLIVAFERHHRLWRYGPWPDGLEATPRAVAIPSGLAAAPGNSGVEALTRLPDGRLLALTEGLEAGPDAFAGWIVGPKGSEPVSWTRTADYHATDLALLPGGDVLVLERRYTPATGPGMRLLRLKGSDIVAGARLTGSVLAELPARLSIDNMECLSVRVVDGHTRVYVLSDDNYNPLERTLLLVFELAG